MTRGGWRALAPIIVLFGLVVAATVWWLADSTGESDDSGAVDIVATGRRFDDLAGLVDASDLVVVGTVVDVADGRTLTDPADPDAGLRTQLLQVEVDDVVIGDVSGPLVLEQEATLLDGTPMVVNGVAPLRVGDNGIMFLVRGDTDEFPYAALVNEQGWVPVLDAALAPIEPDDPIWGMWTGRSPLALREHLAD
ncbi:MAG: hypothetical protein WBP59_15065 [Ilumatobacteraceae bacterium]